MPWKALPPEFDALRDVGEMAVKSWAPNAAYTLKALSGGLSGAAVFRVDFRPSAEGEALNGTYILKLSLWPRHADQTAENVAYKLASEFASEFAAKHIPKLKAEFPPVGTDPKETNGYAMLYSIAGQSLDAFQTASNREDSSLREMVGCVSRDLLHAWVATVPEKPHTPHELLTEWLGYRLSPDDAPEFHTLANRILGTSATFTEAAEVLIHPLHFCEELKQVQIEPRPQLKALLHHDLHGGNLLFYARDPQSQPYQIIDFGLSKMGPAGFDQAYLELYAILNALGELPASALIGLLKTVDRPERSERLPNGALWAADIVKTCRAAVHSWQQQTLPDRKDDVDRQFYLARVAAGINWANKPMGENKRFLALCYAGWAARLYVERHEPTSLGRLLRNTAVHTLSHSSHTDDKLWNVFLDVVGQFARNTGRYILVAEGLSHQPLAASLGQLPWSAVIDLDPESETKGLHHLASAILKCHRGLHVFEPTSIPTSNLDRGCAWMLAGGRLLSKQLPQALDDWVAKTLPRIRVLLQKVFQETTPTPLFVVMLPGASRDPRTPMERLNRIADVMFEASNGEATTIILGGSDIPSQLRHKHVPLALKTFLERLNNLYGTSTIQFETAVPSARGWTVISVDRLRTMQECLLVLHSRVLDDESEIVAARDSVEFWRGNPPLLHDLAADIDIPRNESIEKLQPTLRDRLEAHTNHTVVFYHQPGSGGTTVALRAAWDLRLEYPVAIIHKWSDAVVDRVASLFRLAEKPVLVVAEASVLSETDREDLHRNLRDRNCRAVLLYVRRVLKEPEDDVIGLVREMDAGESAKFFKAYSGLTTDPRRLEDLRRITSDTTLARFRSPFFYGLITFERDYVGLERYVEEHLRNLREKPRTLLKYLAICTIYSNSGIPEAVCKLLRNYPADAKLALEELLGEGPARLVTARAGQWRLQHQVIAEEVLSRITGGGYWRVDLVDMATDFIRELRACTDAQSEQVNELLREVFTDRQGGGSTDADDRGDFAPLVVEVIDSYGSPEPGKVILKMLTDEYPHNPHFWNHLGRFQVYKVGSHFDFAESCLQTAVGLSPHDRIHHNTLGVVRRARAREVIDRMKSAQPSELLEAVRPHYEGAADAFAEARKLGPEDPYGYICHLQMIVRVAHAVKRALGIDNVAQIGGEHVKIADWLAEQLSLAENLLNDARRLYGVLDRNRDFLNECAADLSKLYGDLDSVILIWEVSESSGRSSNRSRRALANAFFARGKRQWRQLSQAEIRRISTLMRVNLRESSRLEEDYRLWFEASIQLPEFDFDWAITNLSAWSHRYSSWRPHYYLYILFFQRWFAAKSNSLTEMESALDQCKNLVIGRKTNSEQWMAVTPIGCPLISSLDLGGWDRTRDFWPHEQYLRRVNGIITRIDGPQAGKIQIDGEVDVFFVPGAKRKDADGKSSSGGRYVFERNQDEETMVNFYLGFSPSGLRGWMVQPGHISEGGRAGGFVDAEIYRSIQLAEEAVPAAIAKSRLEHLQLQTVMRFTDDLIKARADLGVDLTLTELQDRIEAAFGIDGLFGQKRADLSDFANVLLNTGEYELIESGEETIVRPKGDSESASDAPPPFYLSGVRQLGIVTRYTRSKRAGSIRSAAGVVYSFTAKNVEGPSRPILQFQDPERRVVEFSEGSTTLDAVAVRFLAPELTLYSGKSIDPTELRPLVEETISRLVRKAADKSEPIRLRDLQSDLEREFPGSIWLFKRLGHESFSALLKTLPDIRINKQSPEWVVVLAKEPVFGRLPSSVSPPLSTAQPKLNVSASGGGLGNDMATNNQRPRVRIDSPQPSKPQPIKAVLDANSSPSSPADRIATPTKNSTPSRPAVVKVSVSEAQSIIRQTAAEFARQGKQTVSIFEFGDLCSRLLRHKTALPKKLKIILKDMPEFVVSGDSANLLIQIPRLPQ
ncbi:hypothetical protein [Prosthecobacter fluviatilis]|uniref:HTH OST-type domain-containing protein n=1 Tax=Prosthecobacter fluviatilis TaxID=445931 RepID=A0ABW0KJ90_9BACT